MSSPSKTKNSLNTNSASMQSYLPTNLNMETIQANGSKVLQKLRDHPIAVKVVGTLAALYAARSIYCRLQRKLKNYPPGPIGIPFLGSLFSAIDIPKFASYLASNYGSVTMMYIGTQPFVFLHSIDTIHQVFKNKKALDRDWNHSFLFRDLKPSELHVAVVEEKYWSVKRRLFQSIMISRVDSAFLNRVHNRSLKSHVCKAIECAMANVDGKGDGLWHFGDDVSYIQFHAIWNACYGTFLRYESPERETCVNFILTLFDEAGLDVLVRYLYVDRVLPRALTRGFFATYPRFIAFLERNVYSQLGLDASVFDMGERKWDAHFAAHVQGNADACAAAKILHAHRAHPDPETSTKQSILSALSILFFAGVDTSIHNTEYALVLLAKNPEIQERVHAELRGVFDDPTDIEMEHIRFAHVVSRLHLFRAFFQEVLRLSSIVATGVAHFNKKGAIAVTGVHPKTGASYVCTIPRSSVIISDIPSANRTDPYWVRKCGGDGMRVCLDAWLDGDGHFKLGLNKEKNMAFGVGKRDCAGTAMAMRSMYVIFAKLMLLYKFALPVGVPDDVEIKQHFEFTYVMTPKIGLRVEKRPHTQFSHE